MPYRIARFGSTYGDPVRLVNMLKAVRVRTARHGPKYRIRGPGEVSWGPLIGRPRLMLTLDPLGAANIDEHREDAVLGDPVTGKHIARRAVAVRRRDQEVLRADVLVLQPSCLLLRFLKELVRPGGKVGLDQSLHLREPFQRLIDVSTDRGRVRTELLQDRRDSAFLLFDERTHEMFGLDLLMFSFRCQFLGGLHRLLGLQGKFTETRHDILPTPNTHSNFLLAPFHRDPPDRNERMPGLFSTGDLALKFLSKRDDGRRLQDGGAVAEVPVGAARALGGPVLAVEVSEALPVGQPDRDRAPLAMFRSAAMGWQELRRRMLAEADAVIAPAVNHLHWGDYERVDEAVAAGRAAARAFLAGR